MAYIKPKKVKQPTTWSTKLLRVAIVFLVLCLLALVIHTALKPAKSSTSGAEATSTTKPLNIAPGATPVSTSQPETVVTPSAPATVDDGDSVQECSVAIKPTEYATFVTQILSYEQARLSPETQQRKTLLDSLTSPTYQSVNPLAVDPNAQTNLKIVIDPKGSKVSCFASPDGVTRYVSVTPNIETETINADGTTTIRNSYFKTPQDSTTWTLIGSKWLLASTNG